MIFKLKRGFRTLFETTVFGYVRRVRMEKALAMLQIGPFNVSEVATAAGYTCLGHFSVAFRNGSASLPVTSKGRERPNEPLWSCPEIRLQPLLPTVLHDVLTVIP